MKILIVEQEVKILRYLAKYLHSIGHEVVEACSAQEGMAKASTEFFPMILANLNLSDMSGTDFTKHIVNNCSQPAIVLYTDTNDLSITPISILRSGAYSCLMDPFSLDDLRFITEKIQEYQALKSEHKLLNTSFEKKVKEATREYRREILQLWRKLADVMGLKEISFYSGIMRQIAEQARLYHVDRTISVLIEGETGVGKEVIARLIHYNDAKLQDPFIGINCAALNATLFESELFGYESGSFTGASSKGRVGKIALADGGTLFLDEIGDMPLEIQAKLLRVLQERAYYRVGGLKKLKMNTRIICATNADLAGKVEKGKFRKDLYYRLCVGHIIIPPLRERKEEIIPLAQQFLQQYSSKRKKRFKSISPDAAAVLLEHTWPGNIRELKNVLEWATLMYDDEVLLPKYIRLPEKSKIGCFKIEGSLKKSGKVEVSTDHLAEIIQEGCKVILPKQNFNLESVIDQIYVKAYELHDRNKTKAAQYLGISRRNLAYRLQNKAKRWGG